MKMQELQEEKKPGTFLGVHVSKDSKSDIMDFIKDNDIPNPTPKTKLHCTVIYSTNHVDIEPQGKIDPPWEAEVVGFEKWRSPPNTHKNKMTWCCIMKVKCKEIVARHESIMDTTDATYGFSKFKTHLTLSYDIPGDFNIKNLKWTADPIMIDNEYIEELNTNWNAN